MIEKIISGGQTGADQGALDAAIKLGIPHGGWIPKGRLTENGPLSKKYHLIEMPTESYPERTKKNIRESDGTLILSHGRLTGGSEYTRKWTLKYGKPMLHIDLNNMQAPYATAKIYNWTSDHDIKVLNVAGPRASKDTKIYDATIYILEDVYSLDLTEHQMDVSLMFNNRWKNEEHPIDMPKTVDEAAQDIIGDMDLRNKVSLANLTENELIPIQLSLGMYIKEKLKIWSVNKQLEESCIQACREEGLDESNPAMVIVKRIWERLKKTYKLRIVE
jgi:hypothetical protein